MPEEIPGPCTPRKGLVINPLPGAYDHSDPFGGYYGGRRKRPHTGSDFNRGVGAGTPLPAMTSGVVTYTGHTDWNGYCITVHMDNGDGYYAYLHMLEKSPIPAGTWIPTGYILGKLGNTGYNSLGAHLHITCSKGPRPHEGEGPLFDPYAYIRSKGGVA